MMTDVQYRMMLTLVHAGYPIEEIASLIHLAPETVIAGAHAFLLGPAAIEEWLIGQRSNEQIDIALELRIA